MEFGTAMILALLLPFVVMILFGVFLGMVGTIFYTIPVAVVIWIIALVVTNFDTFTNLLGGAVVIVFAVGVVALIVGATKPMDYKRPPSGMAKCPTCRRTKKVGRRGMMKYHLAADNPGNVCMGWREYPREGVDFPKPVARQPRRSEAHNVIRRAGRD